MVLFKPGLLCELQLMLLRQSSSKCRCQLYVTPLVDEVAAQKRLENPILVLLLDKCFCRGRSISDDSIPICYLQTFLMMGSLCIACCTPEDQSVITPPQICLSSSCRFFVCSLWVSKGTFCFLTLNTCPTCRMVRDSHPAQKLQECWNMPLILNDHLVGIRPDEFKDGICVPLPFQLP